MAVRRGLKMGRGLEALFPQRTPREDATEGGAKKDETKAGAKAGAEKTEEKANAKPAKPSAATKKAAVKPGAAKKAAGKTAGKAAKKAATGAAASKKNAKAAKKSAKKPSSAATAKTAKPVETAKAATATASRADNKSVTSTPTTTLTAPQAPATQAAPQSAPQNAPADGVYILRIADVVPNAGQPRKQFSEEAIAELADSIREFGVLQPLLVQRRGEKYEIIAGERRYRAAKSLGMTQIPAIIREYTDRETFEISLIENLQRENLNPIEEAEAYRRLIEEFDLTQEAVSKRVSKSRTAITNALRLLKLEGEVRQMLVDGALSMGHARALLALESPDAQILAAKRVSEGGLSVRDTERLVKRLLHPTAPREKTRADEQIDAVYRSIEQQLQRRTGTKVSIHKGHGNSGRIEIEYYSQADLERIISLIG